MAFLDQPLLTFATSSVVNPLEPLPRREKLCWNGLRCGQHYRVMTDINNLLKSATTRQLLHALFQRVDDGGGLAQTKSEPAADFTPPMTDPKLIASKLLNLDSSLILRQLRLNARIFGNNSLKDMFEVKNQDHQRVSNGVAALVPSDEIEEHDSYHVRLVTQKYGEQWGTCRMERFFDQPSGTSRTAFLVAPTLVVTALHTVSHGRWNNRQIVFGFRIDREGELPRPIPKKHVYRCNKLLYVDYKNDLALIELDRPVDEELVPLKIRRSENITTSTALYTLGHFGGLPLKFIDEACVRSVDENSFRANLDAQTGSSGSPVFNAETHEVEGVLLNLGEKPQWQHLPPCRLLDRRPDDEGEGVICSMISLLAPHIP